MDKKYNRNNIKNARFLRKNMTKEERHLWYDFLRNYPIRFRRQAVMGRYIIDFYCASCNLAIELDGSQHYDNPSSIKKDVIRTDYLEAYGIRVIRIQNTDINNNFYGVCEYIDRMIKQSLGQQS